MRQTFHLSCPARTLIHRSYFTYATYHHLRRLFLVVQESTISTRHRQPNAAIIQFILNSHFFRTDIDCRSSTIWFKSRNWFPHHHPVLSNRQTHYIIVRISSLFSLQDLELESVSFQMDPYHKSISHDQF